MRKIRWTQKQRQILHMMEQGYTDQQIREDGHGMSNITRVKANIKGGHYPPPLVGESPEAVERPGLLHPENAPIDKGTIVRDRILEPVSVGGLFIEPQDWRVNQYGGFLILNTFAYARQKYGYVGTVGDFICDCVQVARRAMGQQIMPFDYIMQEVEDDGGRPDEGGAVSPEAGDGLSGVAAGS